MWTLNSDRPKFMNPGFYVKRIWPQIDNSKALTRFLAHISWFMRKTNPRRSSTSLVAYRSQSKLSEDLLYSTNSLLSPIYFFFIPNFLDIPFLKPDSKDGSQPSHYQKGHHQPCVFFKVCSSHLSTTASINSRFITTLDKTPEPMASECSKSLIEVIFIQSRRR